MLTCYSALLYLLAIYRTRATVSPVAALTMTQLTPTGRLEWLIRQNSLSSSRQLLMEILQQYDGFLKTTNVREAALLKNFEDKDASRRFIESAYSFGDLIFEALASIAGKNNQFYRVLMV